MKLPRVLIACVLALAAIPNVRASNKAEITKGEVRSDKPAILWREPSDISSRNLFYGPGGSAHSPHGRFTFVKEDLNGTNPKFVVRDSEGIKWKVKLGDEARPEIAATRLVWAAGYFANEDYFLPVVE